MPDPGSDSCGHAAVRTFHWSTGSQHSPFLTPLAQPVALGADGTHVGSGRVASGGTSRRHAAVTWAVTAAAPGYALPDVPSVTDVTDAYCLLPGAQIDASNGICGGFVVHSANAPAGAASFC